MKIALLAVLIVAVAGCIPIGFRSSTQMVAPSFAAPPLAAPPSIAQPAG